MQALIPDFLARHADLLAPFVASGGAPPLFWVSVSGGADSIVLCELLRRANAEAPPRFQLEVLHFNFSLRGEESDRDEALVQRYCDHHHLKLHRVKASDAPETGKQEWARHMRLSTLKQSPAAAIFEAHHRDDQVETFLFRLFRGSGLKGLASIRERSVREGKTILRPLLAVTKSELLDFAKKEGLDFVHDSSNCKSDYSRNWIRHEILARLEARFPGASQKMAAVIGEIQDAEDLEARRGDEGHLMSRVVQHPAPEEWRWSRGELRALDFVTLKRLVRELLWRDFQIQLSREQTDALVSKIKGQEAFCVNAPRNLQIRSRGADEPLILRLLSKSTIQESTL